MRYNKLGGYVAVLSLVLSAAMAIGQERWRGPQDRGWGRAPDGPGREAGIPPGERLGKLFEVLDADHDGKVDKEELSGRLPRVMMQLRQRAGGQEPGGRGSRGFMGQGRRGFGPPDYGRRGPGMGEKSMRKGYSQRRGMCDRCPWGQGYGFQGPGSWRGDWDRDQRPGFGGPQQSRRGRGGFENRSRGPGSRFGQPGQGQGRADWGMPPWAEGSRQRGMQSRRPERGGRGMGMPPAFGMLDGNRDGKIQKREVQRAHQMLSKLLEEFGDREELTQEQMANIIKEHRKARSERSREFQKDKPERRRQREGRGKPQDTPKDEPKEQ